jgi:hypothetical protein
MWAVDFNRAAHGMQYLFASLSRHSLSSPMQAAGLLPSQQGLHPLLADTVPGVEIVACCGGRRT